jgi:hypothetical protein
VVPQGGALQGQGRSEPCLWRWEIRDPKTDKVVANSWTNDLMAYQTSEDALRAVAARLGSMARARRAGACARHNVVPDANSREDEQPARSARW